jgi:hypothetical protein
MNQPHCRRVAIAALIAAVLAVAAPRAGGAPGDVFPGEPRSAPDQLSAIDQAAALIQSAPTANPPDKQVEMLAQARTLLETVLREHPNHAETPRAEMWFGALLTTEGKAEAEAAKTLTAAVVRQERLEAARKRFREGDQTLAVAVDRLAKRLKSIPKFIEADTPEHRMRESLKATFIQAQMFHAAVVEEWAGTYPAGGSDARRLYQAAADRYEAVYRDYRVLLAGLIARLKQGQCYRNLGDTKRALGLYNDVLSQPDELAALRRLRVTAMYLSLECWTTAEEKLFELAFSQGEEYLAGVRPEEKSWPEWQAVRFHTARGYLLAAGALTGDRLDERPELLVRAGEHAAALSESDGPYRSAATSLLAEVRRAEQRN